MPSLEDIYLFTIGLRRVKRIMIGPVVKRYGPFRLHTCSYVLKSGRTLNSSTYFVVAGELAVPLSLNWGTGDDDPNGYTKVVRRREGPFRECVHADDLPIKRSSERDLYKRIDKWLKNRQTTIDCYTDQLAVASDASTGNPRRAAFYGRNVAEMAAEHKIVSDAFRAFVREYPAAALTARHDPVADAREARRVRKTIQRTIWAVDKLLK